jgi:hypothetical protein
VVVVIAAWAVVSTVVAAGIRHRALDRVGDDPVAFLRGIREERRRAAGESVPGGSADGFP